MRLLLVRHGQTVGNILRQLQDDHDPLTELGRQQAYGVAAHLATLEAAEALYCSPLPRAIDTATTIGAAIGLEPQPRPAWAEINVGRAAGHTFDGWREQFPDEPEPKRLLSLVAQDLSIEGPAAASRAE